MHHDLLLDFAPQLPAPSTEVSEAGAVPLEEARGGSHSFDFVCSLRPTQLHV